MKKKKPIQIISMTYSLELSNETMRKIIDKDYSGWRIRKGISLANELKKRKEIAEVNYTTSRLVIKILTDSVKKYDPSKNLQFWYNLGKEIENYINYKKEEVND